MSNGRDSEDLEALFDQISTETLAKLDAAVPVERAPAPQEAPDAGSAFAESAGESEDFYHRIGGLTRQLHDALRELGYHKKVELAVNAMPDTRQRLDYIARLTGDAAERTLSNVEKGQEILDRVEGEVTRLGGQWQKLYDRELGVGDFKQVASDTHAFFARMKEDTSATQSLMTDIMMAQDFHDLTGQVIQKVVKLAQDFESELVKLLIDSTPADKRKAAHSEWMNGPVIDAGARDDVVTNQAQVDDLLESLGF